MSLRWIAAGGATECATAGFFTARVGRKTVSAPKPYWWSIGLSSLDCLFYPNQVKVDLAAGEAAEIDMAKDAAKAWIEGETRRTVTSLGYSIRGLPAPPRVTTPRDPTPRVTTPRDSTPRDTTPRVATPRQTATRKLTGEFMGLLRRFDGKGCEEAKALVKAEMKALVKAEGVAVALAELKRRLPEKPKPVARRLPEKPKPMERIFSAQDEVIVRSNGRLFTITPKVIASRKVQGRYMGLLKQLGRLQDFSGEDRDAIKALARAEGIPAVLAMFQEEN